MNIPDDDHVLTEGAGWFDIDGFAIRIHRTDEGVVVDIFDSALAVNTGDYDTALMASTYAFTHELSGEEVDLVDTDDSDDGAALASAGHGTDEDYGSAGDTL